MAQLFSNNAVTTLAAGISAVATELTVAPGKGDNFPVVVGGSGDFFVATLEDAAGNREFIRVDVRGVASDTLGSATFPLQRGHFGTTPRAWLLGDTVDLRFTAESMQGLLTPEQSIIPGTTALYDIGSPTFQYRNLELSGQVNAATVVLSSTAQVGGLLTLLAGANITGNADVTGNITVGGTVDGRDVAADGTKLDGIEAGATADQSNAEIETAYNAQVPAASQVEAEAGTEVAIRRWSPLRVAQAIAALETPSSGASGLLQLSDGAGGFTSSANLSFAADVLTLAGLVDASQSGAAARAGRFYSNTATRTVPVLEVVNDNLTGAGVAARIQQDQGATAIEISNNGGFPAHTLNGSSAYLLIDEQTFTASGTWTKPAGTQYVEVIAVGGGGGGSGTLATAVSTGCCGDAGGGGALSFKRISSGLGATETVTVGTGGAGGTAGGTGGTGTASTFGTHLTANAGAGGSGPQTGSIPRISRADMGNGGSIHVSADWGIRGQMGLQGFLLNTNVGTQSRGGASGWCPGGISQTVVGINNNGRSADADSYGAGGNAPSAGNSQPALNGGAGAGGIVIVRSYG